MYPPMPIADGVSTVTRAQVKAELREAIRLGLIVSGEHDFPTITPAQGRMIAAAGRRALDALRVAEHVARAPAR